VKETFLSSTKGSLVAVSVGAEGGVDGATREVVVLLDFVIVSGIERHVIQTSTNENLEREKEKKSVQRVQKNNREFYKAGNRERERCRKRDAFGD